MRPLQACVLGGNLVGEVCEVLIQVVQNGSCVSWAFDEEANLCIGFDRAWVKVEGAGDVGWNGLVGVCFEEDGGAELVQNVLE